MNVDAQEIAKFNAQTDWWDEHGAYRPLHQLNPLRLNFIEQHVVLAHKRVIDIGCGGGILTEALAKADAHCTGLDLGVATLEVAKQHAVASGLNIDYRLLAAEDCATQQPAHYDVVVCYEMLEHVPNPAAIIQACAALVKDQGWVFLSTLNRTSTAYLKAILGAEYVLKLLPKGTHSYSQFIKPSELLRVARAHRLELKQLTGMDYALSRQSFHFSTKVDVNYLVALQKNS